MIILNVHSNRVLQITAVCVTPDEADPFWREVQPAGEQQWVVMMDKENVAQVRE